MWRKFRHINLHHTKIVDTTRILSGKFGRGEIHVKDTTGHSISGVEDQKTRWMEHFNNLLNRPPPKDPHDIQPAEYDLSINCDPPSIDEIESAIKKQKSSLRLQAVTTSLQKPSNRH